MYVVCVGLGLVALASATEREYCINTSFRKESLRGSGKGCIISCIKSMF